MVQQPHSTSSDVPSRQEFYRCEDGHDFWSSLSFGLFPMLRCPSIHPRIWVLGTGAPQRISDLDVDGSGCSVKYSKGCTNVYKMSRHFLERIFDYRYMSVLLGFT